MICFTHTIHSNASTSSKVLQSEANLSSLILLHLGNLRPILLLESLVTKSALTSKTVLGKNEYVPLSTLEIIVLNSLVNLSKSSSLNPVPTEPIEIHSPSFLTPIPNVAKTFDLATPPIVTGKQEN